MIQDLFMFGWSNMKHRPLRSWLTIIGVIIGIAAIVALIGLGRGLENAIVEQFTVLGSDRIRVVPEGLTGPPIGVKGLTQDDVDVVAGTVGVDYAGGLIFATAPIEYNNEEVTGLIKGLDAEFAEKDQIDINLVIGEGNWYKEGESNVAVIGPSLAEEVFDKEIRLKNSIEIDKAKFKVVGIFEPVGQQDVDQVIYIPFDDAKELFNQGDTVNAVFAAVEEGKDLDEVAGKIENNLERKRNDDNFVVFTPDNILNQLNSILTVVQFILAGIAGISLVVGGIGIMNSMYTSVLERTRQIGVMKAIGASPGHILVIFMLEAGLIGLVGGIMGAILGNILAFSVEGIAKLAGFGLLSITILWDVIGFSLLFAFVVGLISGIYPAYRAARLNPVDALRYE